MKMPKIIYKPLGYILVFLFLLLIFFSNITVAQQIQNKKQGMNDSTLMMRQRMIHMRGHLVMPFNMNKVTHYFIDTKTGGILKIKVKNSIDTIQIKLIREHLKKEYGLFSKADFKDPKTLHGNNMPGLKVLTNSKGKYKVEYKELFDGAQLTFSSKNSRVIKALHTWFAAQLRDHGSDAKSHE